MEIKKSRWLAKAEWRRKNKWWTRPYDKLRRRIYFTFGLWLPKFKKH